jgi:hypothetical protein
MATVTVSNQIGMLSPGHLGLGTRWRETRDVLGLPDSADMEVTSFERDKTYTTSDLKASLEQQLP